jgi:hypothetical protein
MSWLHRTHCIPYMNIEGRFSSRLVTLMEPYLAFDLARELAGYVTRLRNDQSR